MEIEKLVSSIGERERADLQLSSLITSRSRIHVTIAVVLWATSNKLNNSSSWNFSLHLAKCFSFNHSLPSLPCNIDDRICVAVQELTTNVVNLLHISVQM
uniref:Uncharacterized protein n=1 Tax=Meloidogyne incognita TaxID=6306 RepID=A0A914NDY5_MELIC